MDILFQWKESEPCGGGLAAAWIFGIFYLFTVNHSPEESGIMLIFWTEPLNDAIFCREQKNMHISMYKSFLVVY